MKKIIKIISVPIAAQIAIVPIMVKNFNTISFTFLISNSIAVPLLGVSIIGGFLLTLLSFIWGWAAQQMGVIFNLILKFLMFIARFCGNLKISNIYVITLGSSTVIIYYFVVVFVIYFFQYREKLVARRCCIFLWKTWRKKKSNTDEMRRTYKGEL